MFARGVMPFLRRVTYCVCPVVLTVIAGAIPAAMAQSQPSEDFASSTQSPDISLTASSEGGVGLPASPAPVTAASPVAGQSDASYGSHHQSWSGRLAFEAGAGANAPIGNDIPFITWGYNLTLGGGLHISRHLSMLVEYQFMHDKLPGGLIADAGAEGGYAHIWSFTMDPVIDFFPAHRNDMYVTGGGGFYRKVTSFTDPQLVLDCYYFCEVGVEDVVVSHFSSNQGGVNIGLGLTHKIGSDEGLKAFAEARYLWIDTPRIGTLNGLGTTGLIPITLGVRW
jgi:Outer membrane protein beta-barrel domain